MVKEIQYTSIKRVLDNLLDHPMLSSLSLEQVVRHTIRFMGLHGYNKLYQDKIADVEIHKFRGVLPCDLISIVQVKDLKTGICMRSMTDTFTPGLLPEPPKCSPRRGLYIPPAHYRDIEETFKTQGRVIFTSFPEGTVQIAYKAIPLDEDGYPLLIDNETYLAALEAYIKKQVFTVLFDTGKFGTGKQAGAALQNAKQEYAMLSAELQSEFQTPSVSEMEAISRSLTAMIPRMRDFDKGFRYLGNREYLRKH